LVLQKYEELVQLASETLVY